VTNSEIHSNYPGRGAPARIDAAPEARARGRSHFLRQAAEAYLRHLEDQAIRGRYARGYTDPDAVAEAAGWPEEEQVWPKN
jgi:hypothetical protein